MCFAHLLLELYHCNNFFCPKSDICPGQGLKGRPKSMHYEDKIHFSKVSLWFLYMYAQILINRQTLMNHKILEMNYRYQKIPGWCRVRTSLHPTIQPSQKSPHMNDNTLLPILTSSVRHLAGTSWPGRSSMMSPSTRNAQGRFTTAPSLYVHCSDTLGANGAWRLTKCSGCHSAPSLQANKKITFTALFKSNTDVSFEEN